MKKVFEALLQPTFPTERLNNRSILITGGNGLIGSSCVDLLEYLNNQKGTKISISVMCRSREKAIRRFGEHTEIHLLIQDAVEPIDDSLHFDYIVHTAGLAHPKAYSKFPVEVMKTTLISAMNMLDYVTAHHSRLLFVSSGEVYGENLSDKPFEETDAGYVNFNLSRACYPESKRAAETLCVSYHNQYSTDVVTVRPSYIYGFNITEDNSRADAQFLKNVQNGENIILKSAGSQLRTYCHAYDCAAAMLYVLAKGKSGEAYNIANKNSAATIRTYAETLAKLGGVGLKFELPDTVEASGYSKSQKSVLCANKLEALGWTPILNLEDGLKEVLSHSLN